MACHGIVTTLLCFLAWIAIFLQQALLGPVKLDWLASYSRVTEDRPNERHAAVKLSGEDYGSHFADVGHRQPYSTLALPSHKL